MTWLSAVPWLVAYAFGLMVMVAIAAWVVYVMAEVARVRRHEILATARGGLARGRILARRLPLGHRGTWRRAVTNFAGGPSRRAAAGRTPTARPGRGSLVVYVGPGYWFYISAWVIEAHPDGCLDLEWVHPLHGTPVRTLGVRPKRDETTGGGYWQAHPASLGRTAQPAAQQ